MLSYLSILIQGTSIGRSKWLSMINGSKLQINCKKEGINPLKKLRIGIVGNNENDCISVDSYFGIGIRHRPYCQSGYTVRSGNAACTHSSSKLIATKRSARSFILIQ